MVLFFLVRFLYLVCRINKLNVKLCFPTLYSVTFMEYGTFIVSSSLRILFPVFLCLFKASVSSFVSQNSIDFSLENQFHSFFSNLLERYN